MVNISIATWNNGDQYSYLVNSCVCVRACMLACACSCHPGESVANLTIDCKKLLLGTKTNGKVASVSSNAA